MDRLDELDEQNPALTPKDQGRPPSIQSRQLARVAFQKATEVLGHADKLHTEAENRKQRAIESDDDDEEFDYAEESQWEAKVLVDCALEHRERTLSRFSEEFTQALGAREQAKAELDAQYSAGGTPIQSQTYEYLRQTDHDFFQIRKRVIGEIALDG